MDRLNVQPKLPAPVVSATYNEANQMLTFQPEGDTEWSMTYDENGNLTSITNSCGTTTYTWDARNRLIGINGYDAICHRLYASFKYDALGRRIEKTINGRTIQYLYDGLDIVQEIEDGIVTVNYIRTLNIDEPLARISSDGTIRYYHSDALGSIIALTDELGTVRTQYNYSPFGETEIIGEPSDNPFQYTGRENDGTGLYYYRARYYSPRLKRFISEDPLLKTFGYSLSILFQYSANLQAYVHNNPINKIDPYGLMDVPVDPFGRGSGWCVECDWEGLGNCLFDVPQDPNTLMACANCRASKGADIEACYQCVSDLLSGSLICFMENCEYKTGDECKPCP